MKQQFDRPKWNDHHFYATSVGEWKTDKELEPLLKFMKSAKQPFSLYYVPLPEEATYEINMYVPQVEGIKFLGHWE